MKPPGEWKCDYCDKPATRVAGETNGILVCDEHARKYDNEELEVRGD